MLWPTKIKIMQVLADQENVTKYLHTVTLH